MSLERTFHPAVVYRARTLLRHLQPSVRHWADRTGRRIASTPQPLLPALFVREVEARFDLPALPGDLRATVLEAVIGAAFLHALEIMPIPVKDPPGSRREAPETRDVDAMENKRCGLVEWIEVNLSDELVERYSEVAPEIR